MKTILPIGLQLLVALGLFCGIIVLRGNAIALHKLLSAVLVLYLTGLLDWYTFCSRLTEAKKPVQIAVGILTVVILILVWIWLILIVRAEVGTQTAALQIATPFSHNFTSSHN